ncbi:MAG: hypothetical protein HY810_02025 [Candidatus Omnitrophica bacterium]|nr:hypothetical protein [Candidatus Omnitrophota bacterium]
MRLSILRNILFSLFLVLLLDIFWMQIVKGPEYLRQSENNRIRLVAEEASRGIIYDCNNIPLVENKLAFDIVVVPNEFKEDTREAIFLKLSRLLNIEKKILLEIVLNNSNTGFSPLLIASDVSGETAFLIEQEITNLPGVFVQTRARRQYIYKEVLAHVIGYVGKMREDEYQQLKKYGYQIRDVIGRSGLEKTFDEVLRGNSGGMQLEVNSAGKATAACV